MHEVLVNCLFKLAQEKKWLGELTAPPMTIAVDFGRKTTKQTKLNAGQKYCKMLQGEHSAIFSTFIKL